MKFDLNTDRMDRPTLEANYFDAIQKLEALGFGDEQFAEDTCAFFKIRFSAARTLDVLMCGRVLSSEKILEISYGHRAGDITRKNIEVHVCQLRRAFKPFGLRIETVWGVGYRLDKADRDRITDLLSQYREDTA